MNRKIRIALAALAALTALSTVGVTGVASAASRPIEGGVFAIAYNGVAEAYNDGRFWTEVNAWSIGGGGSTTTDEECEAYAESIEWDMATAAAGVALGDYNGAFEDLVHAALLEDKALEDDCVIAYT